MPDRSAYLDGLHLLARRELSVTQVRDRLANREHPAAEIDAAVEHLLETGALNDARVAAAFVRTALKVKGRGRLRIQRELQVMGIPRDVAASALADAFGEVDERSLVTAAIQKKLRGRQTPPTPAEYGRLYQFLMRQGFAPAVVVAALRQYRRRGGGGGED